MAFKSNHEKYYIIDYAKDNLRKILQRLNEHMAYIDIKGVSFRKLEDKIPVFTDELDSEDLKELNEEIITTSDFHSLKAIANSKNMVVVSTFAIIDDILVLVTALVKSERINSTEVKKELKFLDEVSLGTQVIAKKYEQPMEVKNAQGNKRKIFSLND